MTIDLTPQQSAQLAPLMASRTDYVLCVPRWKAWGDDDWTPEQLAGSHAPVQLDCRLVSRKCHDKILKIAEGEK